MLGRLEDLTENVFCAISEKTRMRFVDLLLMALSESQRDLLPEVSPAAVISNRQKLDRVRHDLEASLLRLTEQGLIARTEAPVEEYRTYYITPKGLRSASVGTSPRG